MCYFVFSVEGNTNKEIHSKYDLKGSSLGRSAKEGEKVLKDNDLAEKYGKILLGSQKAAFIKVRPPPHPPSILYHPLCPLPLLPPLLPPSPPNRPYTRTLIAACGSDHTRKKVSSFEAFIRVQGSAHKMQTSASLSGSW